MRKITEAVTKKKLNIQDDSINYISASDLKKYLTVTDKFISDETKEIVNWLIVNNDSYISELSTDDEENALAGFYNAGVPKDAHLKELYKLIGTLVKAGRYKEIPVFLTKSQFEEVISKKKPLDLVINDFESKAGREAIAKQYEALVHKIARSYQGKINIPYDDLVGCCYEGLTYAMNTYSKKNSKSKATDENVNSYTFKSYAAYCMRNQILGNGVNYSHTVRIPTSQQKKERDEKGHNSKSHAVSGDKVVGHTDTGSKTLFDFIGASHNDTDSSVNSDDRTRLWKTVEKAIKNEFDEKSFDVWASFYGMFGHKKLKNKEIASKYNVANSSITYYCSRVINFLKKDKKMRQVLGELRDLVEESLQLKAEAEDIRYGMIKQENESFDD